MVSCPKQDSNLCPSNTIFQVYIWRRLGQLGKEHCYMLHKFKCLLMSLCKVSKRYSTSPHVRDVIYECSLNCSRRKRSTVTWTWTISTSTASRYLQKEKIWQKNLKFPCPSVIIWTWIFSGSARMNWCLERPWNGFKIWNSNGGNRERTSKHWWDWNRNSERKS